MAYVKTNWVDDAAPAVSASNLNKMETGIYNAHVTADAALALASGLPKITTSAFSGGPPSSPTNGDIWIATGVDTSGTRWMFQYNAASGSTYKWEFIGGPENGIIHSAEISTTAINTWMVASTTYSVVRAGDYHIKLWAHFNVDVTMNAQVYTGVRWSGGADFYIDPCIIRTSGDEIQVAFDLGIRTLSVGGTTLAPMGQATAKSAANYPRYRNLRVAVEPVRVA